MLTETEAREYVASIEAKWYGKPSPILSVAYAPVDGLPCFAIDTEENPFWQVWREPTGEIYGEC